MILTLITGYLKPKTNNMKNSYQIFTEYINYKGGVNNLQVSKVVSMSPYKGLCNIEKTFCSKVGKAKVRAEKWVNKNSKV